MHTKNKRLSVLGIFLIGMSVLSFLVFYLIVMVSSKDYHYIDPDTLELVQTEEIQEGEPTAIITTTLGEIRVVLYPDYAPETVAQFIKLAESGHYDNTCIFDVEQDVLFAAGSNAPDGSLTNVTEAQERVPQELHQNLWPFRGAVCAMDTASEGGFFKRLFGNAVQYTGTRFMVLDTVDFSDEAFAAEFKEATESEALGNVFLQWGGIPNFSQQVTVFGQTYAGFDVIDAICAAGTKPPAETGGYNMPEDELYILSVEISAYGEEDATLNELPEIEPPAETQAAETNN